MSNPESKSVEIEIIPFPPDTVASLQGNILSELEAKLREEGYGEQLDNGQIQLDIERNFPTEETIRLIIEIVGLGIEVVDKIVIPYLEHKAEVRRKQEELAEQEGPKQEATEELEPELGESSAPMPE